MGKSTDYVKLNHNVIMQFGEWAFTTTGTTVEIPTKMGTITSAILTPESHTGAAAAGSHVMFCDKTITSGQVTGARKASADSGGKFSYMLIGTMGPTPGTVSAS